jgi:hypothetical protein
MNWQKIQNLDVSNFKQFDFEQMACTRTRCNTSEQNKPFENVANFKYVGKTVTNKNSIQEEIKSTFNSANSYYNSVQSLCLPVFSLSLSKKKLKR